MLQRIQYDLRLFIPSLLGHPIRRLPFKGSTRHRATFSVTPGIVVFWLLLAVSAILIEGSVKYPH
jgi:hypothetical protein